MDTLNTQPPIVQKRGPWVGMADIIFPGDRATMRGGRKRRSRRNRRKTRRARST